MFNDNALSLLKSIDLSNNHFLEETPVKTENLFALVSLNLSRNKLTGKIPSNIRNLRSLEFFDLLRNLLDGSIPQSLTQVNRLFMLDISRHALSSIFTFCDGFSGILPNIFGSLTRLKVFSAESNSFTG